MSNSVAVSHESSRPRANTSHLYSVPNEIGTYACRKFRNKIFDKHALIRNTLVKSYIRIAQERSYVEANLNLIDLSERLNRGDLRLSMDDSEIKEFCRLKADRCRRIYRNRPIGLAAKKIEKLLNGYRLSFPQGDLEPALRRTIDESWWRRQIRTEQKRELEQISRDLRLVHKRDEIYASTTNVIRRRQQKARNRRLLSELKATNQFGQEFTLDQLAEVSVSNPEIRRAELMVRLRGFEHVANARGLVADFYTLTCPSRFHSTHQTGIANASFDGSSAREANQHLCRVWSRTRAKLDREGINIFGFRVAEPHHDGCPHWHLILFMEKDHIASCRRIMRHYALEDSAFEPGAQQHRLKVIEIDQKKGSATGYVAKYISKNIDGKGLDSDLHGNCPIEASERIDAWASISGIRQFQQIGGPSVTVWRELRRLHSQQTGELELARRAADSADWAAYVELMGGPYCGRTQTICLARLKPICETTGEILTPFLNKYGEPITGRIYGLISEGIMTVTRIFEWNISSTRTVQELVFDAPNSDPPPWSTVNNCTRAFT